MTKRLESNHPRSAITWATRSMELKIGTLWWIERTISHYFFAKYIFATSRTANTTINDSTILCGSFDRSLSIDTLPLSIASFWSYSYFPLSQMIVFLYFWQPVSWLPLMLARVYSRVNCHASFTFSNFTILHSRYRKTTITDNGT